MVTATGFDEKTTTGTTSIKTCAYVGLQAACSALCGPVTTALPKDSLSRMCRDVVTPEKQADGSVISLPINTISYKDQVALLQCDNPPSPAWAASYLVTCTLLTTCQTAGNVVMAFAVLGCIGALLSMAVFAWRMNGDGMCAKLTSVVFSTATFICCTTAFGAFQNCAKLTYDLAVSTLTDAIKANPTMFSNPVQGVAPGVGGIMAITSFVFFIYVMLMSIFIPGAAPAAAGGAGLDSKA